MLKILATIFSMGLISGSAFGAIRVDMTPTAIMHKKTLIEDETIPAVQSVFIHIKNVGNAPLRTRKLIKVAVNDEVFSGHLFSPEDKGSILGDPIAAGETGAIILTVPTGTFRHCQLLKVHIDVDHEVQTTTDDSNVFENDQRSLMARELNNEHSCRLQTT